MSSLIPMIYNMTPAFPMKRLYLIWFFCLGTGMLSGRHLVGGDITYTCLGKNAAGLNEYTIRLNVYRDCRPNDQSPTNTPFDPVTTIYIYHAQSLQLARSVLVSLKDTMALPLTGSDTCVAPPTNLCYEYGWYETTVALPDNSSGFHVVWGRCCRNETILNIVNPGEYGMAISARIPDTDLCNNSPAFIQNLPTYICRNSLFEFDHRAVDADGDSLVYQLVTPSTVGSQSDPFPLAPPPPFPQVPWAPPFSRTNMVPGNPPLQLDRSTGLISMRPNSTGQFVFSLIVYEYRNRVQIGSVSRDIQINIIDCPINFPPDVAVTPNDNMSGDTLFFSKDVESCFDFNIEDINGLNVPEDRIVVNIKGPMAQPVSGVKVELVTQTISNITANICWKPPCEFVPDKDSYIVFEAIDQNTCPGPNITLDTFFFRLLPIELDPPEINCITRIDGNSLQLNWDALPPSAQAGFEGYYIYRDDGNGWQEIAQIHSADQDSFVDLSAPTDPGTIYCYRMARARTCPEFMLSEPGTSVCSESAEVWEICQASIINEAVNVSWKPSSISGFLKYNIYRKLPGEKNFQRMESITDQTISSWTDSTLDATGVAACYQLSIVNVCGAEILTKMHCVMPLRLTESTFNLSLDWEPYLGWEMGVETYEVWKIPEEGDPQLLTSLNGFTQSYNDRQILNEEGVYCYQIRAIPVAGRGCEEESYSWLMCYTFDPNLFIPNAFTPNGDGINDRFQINGAFVRRFELNIFDRWGRLVFQAQAMGDSWDGTIKGRLAPEGVYAFKLSAEGFDGKKFERSGSITLIR